MASDLSRELGRTQALDVSAADLAPPPAGAFDDPGVPKILRPALDARLGGASDGRLQPRYRLLGIEGIGATSRVYRAFDADLAREVALKVLSDVGAGEAAEAFIAEARTTAGMQHPNVLPVYELDAGADGELYFSMRRIQGRSLGDALGGDACARDPRLAMPQGVNQVVGVFVDVCQALAYAHHRGIVHQDVKPDNIMLGEFGEVLLVDWGSASHVDDARPRLYGTPLYMSPEQARRERASPASDIFCAGASLFHALIGRHPTGARNLEELTSRRQAGEIDLPSPEERARVPAPLLHIALKAMAPSIATRYASAAALLADLQAYQGGVAIAAYPQPPWQRAWRWCRRNRRACWAAAAAALVVAALLGALAAELAKRRSSWTLVPGGDIDFATASAAEVERRLVCRVKPADMGGKSFHEVPLSASPAWRLEDGRLRMSSDLDYVDIAWRGGLDGDFRAEWDYTPERSALNLDCFVGDDRESGYTFHIGTYGDPRYAALTSGSDELRDERVLAEPLRVGRTYAFALEREGERMRLAIDGATIFDYVDRDPLTAVRATSFGLDCYRSRTQSVARLRVYARTLPELVPPLAIGQALFQSGLWQEAVRKYDAIARAHPGTDLGLTAEASAAICVARAGEAQEGDRRLRAFLEAAPDHAMALPALVEREELLRKRGDAAGATAARARLKRWRGEPILRRVIMGLAEQYAPLLARHQSRMLGDPALDPATGDRLVAAIADLRAWSAAYAVPLEGIQFVREAASRLAVFGRFEEALAACPPDCNNYAMLLIHAGRYQEALDRFGYIPMVRASALLELDRLDEIANDAELDGEDRARAMVESGHFDRALALFPASSAVSDRLLKDGRIDEYLARHPGHERDFEQDMQFLSPRYRAMMARHQYQLVLDEYTHPVCVSTALVALGRFDEAIARFPDKSWLAYRAAALALSRGDTARGADILRRLSSAGCDATGDGSIAGVLLEALLPALLGRPWDPAAPRRDPRASAPVGWPAPVVHGGSHRRPHRRGGVQRPAAQARPARIARVGARPARGSRGEGCRGDRALSCLHRPKLAFHRHGARIPGLAPDRAPRPAGAVDQVSAGPRRHPPTSRAAGWRSPSSAAESAQGEDVGVVLT